MECVCFNNDKGDFERMGGKSFHDLQKFQNSEVVYIMLKVGNSVDIKSEDIHQIVGRNQTEEIL